MSEMAVSDNPNEEKSVLNGANALAASAEDAAPEAPEPPSASTDPEPEKTRPIKLEPEWSSSEGPEPVEEPDDKRGVKRRASAAFSNTANEDFKGFPKMEPNDSIVDYKRVLEPEWSSSEGPEPVEEPDDKRGVKRRASAAFSNTANEDFKGFPKMEPNDSIVDFKRVLENLEAEVVAASKTVVPLRTVMGTPTAPAPASKRARQDTDGSRPSSALSSRSEGEGGVSSTEQVSSSPAARGRRATTEMSSPLLRVPLERGWKRELVYRAALDQHSRRNADIYYYTPQGKKLRSTREVAEHLSGTGLTVENFSFFKEPLGVDDPEKEIIRDAKLMRRVESPVAATAPPAEGKRTPKPKPPKGASPEPATPRSPPAKIKVKSMQPRLNRTPAATPPAKKPAVTAADNNNTQAIKKNRTAPPPAPALAPAAVASVAPVAPAPAPVASAPVTSMAPVAPAPAPPPLQSRPPVSPVAKIEQDELTSPPRQLVQPCSMTCGRGVPTLACGACLCLYHPACAGLVAPRPPGTFFCKNCRKSSSPSSSPPPLTHKSGGAALPAPAPRRVPAPAPAPVPTPVIKPRAPPPGPDKRVTLRMKMAGGPGGAKVWAVSPARGSLPQSLAVLNGRRFIVVPRALVQPAPEAKPVLRGRVANGAVSSPTELPRRRGRPRLDDSAEHFTAFYHKAQQHNYNVCVQIFQYLGMRDLAHCARVCRLWRDLAATPHLWRHVRMKNSHVSDWGGLFAALRRHGTQRLDLRKMLLPQNDAAFWEQFAEHVKDLDQLERIEMCRCPASAVEAVCRGVPNLRCLSALAIRSALLDPAPLGALSNLHELRLKSMAGLSLTRDLQPLAALTNLTHLSLTSIKELGWCACDVVGQLAQLESLELGECSFRAEFALVLARLSQLRRLRLERGTSQCAAPALLRALAHLPLLTSLELVNFDVKVGFDDALAECKNIQRLLIIPTYVSQSATTNKQVLSGVLRLKDTLTHLMWGVTIELLRVTELFIDQCEKGAERRRDVGECIPVLKPVPGCRLPDAATKQEPRTPPQVEILPLPTLQRLLSAQLPNTKLKLLRIPFHATWRQSLADFQ